LIGRSESWSLVSISLSLSLSLSLSFSLSCGSARWMRILARRSSTVSHPINFNISLMPCFFASFGNNSCLLNRAHSQFLLDARCHDLLTAMARVRSRAERKERMSSWESRPIRLNQLREGRPAEDENEVRIGKAGAGAAATVDSLAM